jgi:tetrahydromethanopterin S-methyltransferase subunit G
MMEGIKGKTDKEYVDSALENKVDQDDYDELIARIDKLDEKIEQAG